MVEKIKETIVDKNKRYAQIRDYIGKIYSDLRLPFDVDKYKGIITTDTEIKAFYDNCVIHIDHDLTYSRIEPYKKLIK